MDFRDFSAPFFSCPRPKQTFQSNYMLLLSSIVIVDICSAQMLLIDRLQSIENCLTRVVGMSSTLIVVVVNTRYVLTMNRKTTTHLTHAISSYSDRRKTQSMKSSLTFLGIGTLLLSVSVAIKHWKHFGIVWPWLVCVCIALHPKPLENRNSTSWSWSSNVRQSTALWYLMMSLMLSLIDLTKGVWRVYAWEAYSQHEVAVAKASVFMCRSKLTLQHIFVQFLERTKSNKNIIVLQSITLALVIY